MSNQYGKIFQQIYDGSLRSDPMVRLVFMDMVILADKDGVVDMTHEAIAARTNVPIKSVCDAIKSLEGPDPRSRSSRENGARIKRLDEHRDWGWCLINYEYYIKKGSRADKNEADRVRIAQIRSKNKSVASCSKPSHHVADVAHIDIDIDIKEKERKKKKACAWPKDFKLTEDMKTYAKDKGISPSKVDAFFDDFHDWALSKGATYKDWAAAFRSRVAKAPEYGKQFLAATRELEPDIKISSELADQRFKRYLEQEKAKKAEVPTWGKE